jgi:hypothetical protein
MMNYSEIGDVLGTLPKDVAHSILVLCSEEADLPPDTLLVAKSLSATGTMTTEACWTIGCGAKCERCYGSSGDPCADIDQSGNVLAARG